MISLKTYLIKKLTLEKRLVLLQKLNIPKDSNDDEFMKHLLENKDFKNFCQEKNSKEAQKVYQRMLSNANNPEEIRRIQNDFSKIIQKKETQFPLLFMEYFIAKNLDVKIDAKQRKKIHICECCKKSFFSANHLQKHINVIHNGQRDYKCDSCEKTFPTERNMKLHINSVHNGQKDHQCDSFTKAFSQAANLKTHINAVHNGKKGHKCDSCGKTFSSAQYLKIHINSVHNGQKDHKCDSCGKAFSRSDYLKAFSRAGNLNTHINSVNNGQKDHKCDICGN